MAETLVYDDVIVNDTINNFRIVGSSLDTVGSSLSAAINQLTSATGFGLLGASISAADATSSVGVCADAVNGLVNNTRAMQAQILMYNGNEDAIGKFFSSLSDEEIMNIPKEMQSMYTQWCSSVTNFLSRTGASVLAFGGSVLEGFGEFLETGIDLGNLFATGAASIFTGTYDFVNSLIGNDTSATKDMWEKTKAQVSTKHVENAFNSFYDNTSFGQSIKENSYIFDTLRTVGSGLGYAAGVSSLAVLTGGLSSGVLGTVSVTELGTVAGVMGVSGNAEEAWANGASVSEGLARGVVGGAWEGLQWSIGAKIGAEGGFGNQLANYIFKGNASSLQVAASRVALDAVDSAAEGFVQPALDLMYKDSYVDDSGSEVVFSSDATLGEKYSKLFDEAGGMGSVVTQGLMGGAGSAIGEGLDLSKMIVMKDKSTLDYSNAIEAVDERIDDLASKIFSSDVDSNSASSLSGAITENIDDVQKKIEIDNISNNGAVTTGSKVGLALASIKLFDNSSTFKNIGSKVFKATSKAIDNVADAFTNASGRHTSMEYNDLLKDSLINQSSEIEVEVPDTSGDAATSVSGVISGIPEHIKSFKVIKNSR